MTQILFPLVGSHFRPPAKQLLLALPTGTFLRVVLEPENPYDPNAVGVFFDPRAEGGPQIDPLEVEAVLGGTGFSTEDILGPLAGLLHLGYIGKTGAKANIKLSLPGNIEFLQQTEALNSLPSCSLAFGPSGEPLCRCTWGHHPRA